MKKLLALLPLIGAFALAGCGGEKGNEEGGITGGEKLAYSEDQVKAKVKELETDGYEISCEINATDMEKTTYIIGVKDEYRWADTGSSKMMAKPVTGGLQTYDWDEDENIYKKSSLIPSNYSESYMSIFDNYGAFLYEAAHYNDIGDFTKIRETTFVGRTAIEYKCVFDAPSYGKGSYDLIIDKHTGITLKWAGSATDYRTNETSSGSYEVKSFKTGADVEIPAHEK